MKTHTIRLSHIVWRLIDQTAKTWNLSASQYAENEIRRVLNLPLLKVKRRQRCGVAK